MAKRGRVHSRERLPSAKTLRARVPVGAACRLLLVLLLCAATLRQSAGVDGARGLPQGLTLSVAPATLPFHRRVLLSVRVLDRRGQPVAGAKVRLTGLSVAGSAVQVSGSGPLRFLVDTGGAGTARVGVVRAGYLPVSAPLSILPPAAPAAVSELRAQLALLPAGTKAYRAASLRQPLFFHWQARTGPHQRAALRFADGSVLALDATTEVTLSGPARTYLSTGQVLMQVAAGGQAHDVQTGSAVAATLGTRYVVRVSHGVTTVTVLRGLAVVRSKGKQVRVGPGQQTVARPNQPPSKPHTVDSGAVSQWAAALAPPVGDPHPATGYLILPGSGQLAAAEFAARTVHTLQLPGVANDLTVSPSGETVYVAAQGGLYALPAHGGAARTFRTGAALTAVAATPDGTALLAAGADGTLLVLDPQTGDESTRVALGFAANRIAVAPDSDTAVISGAGMLALVDLQRDTVTLRRVTGDDVGAAAFTADGAVAYLPLRVAGTVLIVSIAAAEIAGAIGLTPGARPVGAVTGLDGLLYVADAFGGAIDVVDPVAAAVRAVYPLGGTPAGVALGTDGKLAVATANPDLATVDPQDGTVLDRLRLGAIPSRLVVYDFPDPAQIQPEQASPSTDLSAVSQTIVSSVPPTDSGAGDAPSTDGPPLAVAADTPETPTPDMGEPDSPTPDVGESDSPTPDTAAQETPTADTSAQESPTVDPSAQDTPTEVTSVDTSVQPSPTEA